MVWVIYNGVGIAKHGFFGYLRHTSLPSGVPVFMWPLIIPLEFVSNIIVRPITLSLRLFANMFAGHLLIAFFSAVAWWFLAEKLTALGAGVGLIGFVMTIVMTAFEIFVQALQAFIFTLLAASYIGGALHPDH